MATNIVSDFGATPTVLPTQALTLALLAYRQRNFLASAEWCQQLLAYPESSAVESATARVILAMASGQFKETAEARRQLEQARDNIEKRFANGLAAGNKSEGFWFDWVLARTLLAEAMER